MKLEIDSRELHSFNKYYNWILESSGVFQISKKETVEYSDFLECGSKIFDSHKYGSISFARINEKLVVFDTTFEIIKTKELIRTGLFNKHKPDLYIKYEHNSDIENMLKCKVSSWVMFPGGDGLVSRFRWDGICNRVATLASGKNSYKILGRQPWFEKAKEYPNKFNTYIACRQSTYANSLKSSKFGVILSIRRDKNTREYEFISNFIPMALNYQPVYKFPFEPNVHYYYMENPDSLLDLEGINAIPYHTRSVQLWENYFKPSSAVGLLLKDLE